MILEMKLRIWKMKNKGTWLESRDGRLLISTDTEHKCDGWQQPVEASQLKKLSVELEERHNQS